MRQAWEEVGQLHRAGLAHRALHTRNVMVDGADKPWIVDFSFSESGANGRQQALDVAELLASFAAATNDADRPVATAAAVLGADEVGRAVPYLQPLALSATTRRAVHHDKLLDRLRASAASVSGVSADDVADVQRVKLRTLLMIAVAAGAFYFLLPQLANVSDSWKAFRSASWGWVAFVVAMSVLTYIGAALGMLG